MSFMDEFYRPCVPTSSTRSSPTVPPPGVDLTANLDQGPPHLRLVLNCLLELDLDPPHLNPTQKPKRRT